MTDDELIKLAAEKVMGWTHKPFPYMENSVNNGCYYWASADGYLAAFADTEAAWNPLTSDRDSCAVLDKMAVDGWEYAVEATFGGPGIVDISCLFEQGWINGTPGGSPSRAENRGYASCPSPTAGYRRRVIVLAALKAKGVDVDG